MLRIQGISVRVNAFTPPVGTCSRSILQKVHYMHIVTMLHSPPPQCFWENHYVVSSNPKARLNRVSKRESL